jgi:hypothetical protein
MLLSSIDKLIQEIEIDNEKIKKGIKYGVAGTVIPHMYANYQYSSIKNKPTDHLSVPDAKLAVRMAKANVDSDLGNHLKAATKTISAGYKHVYDKFTDYF